MRHAKLVELKPKQGGNSLLLNPPWTASHYLLHQSSCRMINNHTSTQPHTRAHTNLRLLQCTLDFQLLWSMCVSRKNIPIQKKKKDESKTDEQWGGEGNRPGEGQIKVCKSMKIPKRLLEWKEMKSLVGTFIFSTHWTDELKLIQGISLYHRRSEWNSPRSLHMWEAAHAKWRNDPILRMQA